MCAATTASALSRENEVMGCTNVIREKITSPQLAEKDANNEIFHYLKTFSNQETSFGVFNCSVIICDRNFFEKLLLKYD